MRDKRQTADPGGDFRPDGGKRFGAFCVGSGKSMHAAVKRAVPVRSGADEAVELFPDFALADEDDADAAYAGRVAVCRLKINGREIS